MSARFAKGDVLRVHHCWEQVSRGGADVLAGRGPVWALSTMGYNSGSTGIVWVGDHAHSLRGIAICCDDIYDIVPPDQWPEEVAVAVARYALTGRKQP